MIGNIGSGKSTIARKLAIRDNNVVFNMDAFQEMVAGGEYGCYDPAKKDIYWEAENATIRKALECELSICIDRTNMDRKRRQRFIQIGNEYGAKIVAYNFGCGSPMNLDNRMKSPRGVPKSVWETVLLQMQKSYEPPLLEEGFSEIIEAPKRFTFHAFDFDGTIVENKFPEIGEFLVGVVPKLNSLYRDLSNIIIVWTCRSGDYENDMRNFMIKNKVPFDFINENPMVNYGSRKIFANVYHDDRNADE